MQKEVFLSPQDLLLLISEASNIRFHWSQDGTITHHAQVNYITEKSQLTEFGIQHYDIKFTYHWCGVS